MALLLWAKTRHDRIRQPKNMKIYHEQPSRLRQGFARRFQGLRRGVYVAIQKSGLPKQLVDIVYLRISQINGCAYCIDMHSRDLLKSGLAVDKLVLVPVWREAGNVFSTRERVALAWAETVTRVAETGVPDAEYEVAAAEFSDEELADLTYAIGLMNVFNRLGISFRSPPAAVAEARTAA